MVGNFYLPKNIQKKWWWKMVMNPLKQTKNLSSVSRLILTFKLYPKQQKNLVHPVCPPGCLISTTQSTWFTTQSCSTLSWSILASNLFFRDYKPRKFVATIFLDVCSLRIQICPKKGVSPIFLFWEWDWDHQSYSREGYGSLGVHQPPLLEIS